MLQLTKQKKIVITVIGTVAGLAVISAFMLRSDKIDNKKNNKSDIVSEAAVSENIKEESNQDDTLTVDDMSLEEVLQDESVETESLEEGITDESILEEEIAKEEAEDEAPAPNVYTIGVKHSTVLDIQQRLMDLGYMEDSEPTDYYGQVTAQAVTNFQRQYDIKQDGILGSETSELLLSEDAKRYAAKLGFRGKDITVLQTRLYELGYLASLDMVTGYFGDVTESAVIKMQENNGLYADGKVGEMTMDLLYSEDVKPNMLSYGEESDIVLAAQNRLKELGYLTTTPDGKYGTDTLVAVKQFQSRNDLVVDGYLGPTTREVLYKSSAVRNGIMLGDSGDAVKRVQELLNKYGYISSANMTGYFGDITDEAVKAFQKNNGLTADGNVGVMTMAKLTSDNAVKANTGSSTGSNSTGNGSSNTGSSSGSGSAGNSSSNSGSSSGSGSTGNSSSNTGSSSGSNSTGNNSSSTGSSQGTGSTVSGSVSELIRIAKSKLGAPYVYGSKGPNSFDCSGFIYWCLNQAGVKQSYLTSSGWVNIGKYKRISSIDDVRAGDIIVVKGHLGIAAGNGMVIDASTAEGKIVYRSISSWWRQRFIVAWRIFD